MRQAARRGSRRALAEDARQPAAPQPTSSRRLLDRRQALQLGLAAGTTAVVLAARPAGFGLVLDGSVALASLGMAAFWTLRLGVLAVGWRAGRRGSRTAPAVDDVPPYTVLVPLYREGNMIGRLTRHLARLDYPADRIEILLLCEHDDAPTITAITELGLDPRFRLVICPPGEPRTKARACNIGLQRATGHYCVIFDAEDRPHLQQLRHAAAAFAASARRIACLQARLDFHNFDVNWLARCFTLEYGALFGFILPGLASLGIPLPLGGTSNHFRTAALLELGGWDPYNVTEDAELGLRLHHAGWRTQMMGSVTLEEACARPAPWMRQRTRWMKGYLQTWAAHARLRAQPPRSRLATHLLVGGTPVMAALLPVLAVLAVALRMPAWPGPPALARILALAATAVLAESAVAQVGGGCLAARAADRPRMMLTALALPLYGMLVSAATFRAVWQLPRQPHLWEKTPHGLSGDDTDPGLR
jgi:hypothetical protein